VTTRVLLISGSVRSGSKDAAALATVDLCERMRSMVDALVAGIN
jgi:hypothetical protein